MSLPVFRADPPVPEWLPGEPTHRRLSGPGLFVRVLLQILLVTVLLALTLPLWPLYLLGSAIWGWPPNVPRAWQVARYLRLAWTVRPPHPGITLGQRVWVMLEVLRKVAVIPFWGCCWLLDELLYGRELRAIEVRAPLIEISAARSGSTQLARYLEEDPHLAAPALLQFVFPYLWLWKIAPHTIGRLVTRERLIHKMEQQLPREFLERHEGDPFRTDTFDGALYISHLNSLCSSLGPRILVEDFNFSELAPHNRDLVERVFPDLMDGIARKTLLHAGAGPDGGPRRFFIKGHFLNLAESLERRYPDARFLTMIREPAPRIQSGINFLRTNPTNMVQGPVPWAWLGEAIVEIEVDYCEHERRWFTAAGPARRCVIRFGDYVRDLEGAMRKVYRECLDIEELPPHVPRVHPPRERTNYRLNRTLKDAGVDEAALNQRLRDYIAWCRGGASGA